jgi:hypothetical protein
MGERMKTRTKPWRERRIKPKPHPGWVRERTAALDQRAAREPREKMKDAFWVRLHEHETLGSIIERWFGIEEGHARHIALAAPTSPASSLGLRRRGRPAVSADLYEAVESVRRWNGGALPLGRGNNFWQSVTLQWNASHRGLPEAGMPGSPERLYLTEDGLPDWRALRSAYLVAKRTLEMKARAIFDDHKINCPQCQAAEASPRPKTSDWANGAPNWLVEKKPGPGGPRVTRRVRRPARRSAPKSDRP